jgi:2,5-diketo-D-gluconate reductase A
LLIKCHIERTIKNKYIWIKPINNKNMKNSKQFDGLNRREFLHISAKVAATAILAGSGASKLFGAANKNIVATTVKSISLNNGINMPIIGFGTLTLNGEIGERCVADAIAAGYRLIDTATIYNNEASVGAGIKL